MMDGKIIIPAYMRTGKCEECGADVYAPAGTETVEGDGLPPMSSCACEGGPQLASEPQLSVMRHAPDSQEKAQAA